jgi:hypothetical protein
MNPALEEGHAIRLGPLRISGFGLPSGFGIRPSDFRPARLVFAASRPTLDALRHSAFGLPIGLDTKRFAAILSRSVNGVVTQRQLGYILAGYEQN